MSGSCDSQLFSVRFVGTKKHPIYHVPTAVARAEKGSAWSCRYHTEIVQRNGQAWPEESGRVCEWSEDRGRMEREQMSLGRSREERGLRSCCQCHAVTPWTTHQDYTAHQDWLSGAASRPLTLSFVGVLCEFRSPFFSGLLAMRLPVDAGSCPWPDLSQEAGYAVPRFPGLEFHGLA